MTLSKYRPGVQSSGIKLDSILVTPRDTARNKIVGSVAVLNNKLYFKTASKWDLLVGGDVLSEYRKLNNPDSLAALETVAISTPLTDQVLKFNGTSWVNADATVVNGGHGKDFFYVEAASDISGYSQLDKVPDTGIEIDEAVVVNNNSVLMNEYASAALGGTKIDAGIWSFDIWAYVDPSSSTSSVEIEIYKRDSGGTETLLFTVNSGALSTTIGSEPKVVITTQPEFAISSTDRMVAKVYGKNTSANNRTVHFHHGGTNHYSHFNTPLITRHNDLAGLQGGATGEYNHLTDAEKIKLSNARTIQDHDSLSTLQEKNYSSLDGKPDLAVYKEKTDSTAGTGYTSRDRLATELAKKINSSLIGANNGITPLDAGGKVSFTYLPASLMIYKGLWNPATNTPALADGTGVNGWVYKCSVDGTANLGSGAISFLVGDFAIHNGTTWERSVGTDNVVSVNGQQGVVSLSTDNVSDYTNKRYVTDAEKTAITHSNRTALDNVSGVNTGDQTLPTALPTPYSVTFNSSGTGDATGTTFNGSMAKTISYNTIGAQVAGSYEPAFSKNTAFNKNFGTTTGTVLEGRTFGTAANSATGDFAASSHNQAWSTITSTPTTLSGYGITDAAPVSGSANYIQNQFASDQFASIRITGVVKAPDFYIGDLVSDYGSRIYRYNANTIIFGIPGTTSSQRIAFTKSNGGTGVDIYGDGTISATGGNSTNWNSAYSYSTVGHLPLSGGILSSENSGSTPMLRVRNYATSGTGAFTGNYGSEFRHTTNGDLAHAMLIHLRENDAARKVLDITSLFGSVASFASNGAVAFGGTVTATGAITAPALNLSGNLNISLPDAGYQTIGITSTTGTNAAGIRFTNSGGNAYIGIDNNAGSSYGGSPYALILEAGNGKSVQILNNAVPIVTVTSSGTVTATGAITAGGTAGQSSALITARSNVNSFEWGHANGSGYLSTFGYYSSAGNPYIAFNGEAGTTNNTFKTRGIKSSIILSDLNGGMQFGNVGTAASTDNQSFIPLVTISSAGAITATGAITAPSATFNGTGTGSILSVQRDSGTNGAFNVSFPSQQATLNSTVSDMVFQVSGSEKGRFNSTGLSVTGSGTFTGQINANYPENDNIYTGGISLGYSVIRGANDHSFNIDTYNGGSYLNALKITQAGNMTVAGSGTFTGGGFNSSRKLKDLYPNWNKSALKAINDFKLRDFSYKTDSGANRTLGFIIDEIPNSVKKYVVRGEKEDAVNLYTLHGLSFKAIQELSKENEKLKEENEDLENRLEKLERIVKKIERRTR